MRQRFLSRFTLLRNSLNTDLFPVAKAFCFCRMSHFKVLVIYGRSFSCILTDLSGIIVFKPWLIISVNNISLSSEDCWEDKIFPHRIFKRKRPRLVTLLGLLSHTFIVLFGGRRFCRFAGNIVIVTWSGKPNGGPLSAGFVIGQQ